jgi:GNAT superfamily N-acetyltransferase
MLSRGQGWVCEIHGQIVGFAIVDFLHGNIWALFILPAFEKRGIGKQLLDIMLNWYFAQTHKSLWLGTEPNTRAEKFYRNAGWTEAGTHGKGEIKFIFTKEDWLKMKEATNNIHLNKNEK